MYEFMFADLLLDSKFRAATEILEQFVSCAAREISASELAHQTDRTVREVNVICRLLAEAGLVRSSEGRSRSWMLVCDPVSLTLEDVYRALSRQAVAADHPSGDDRELLGRSVDLLISQATMAVNQSVAQHLRQFSLNRPKTAQLLFARR